MKYTWLNVGDQDQCIHKRCFLGIWQLSIREADWKGDTLLVECKAYVWSETDEAYVPVKMKSDKLRKYGKNYGKNCKKYMEDWYAEHVIMPKLMMGTDDGQVATTAAVRVET